MKATILRVLRWYLAVGLMEVLVRVLRARARLRRARRMLRDVPEARYVHHPWLGGVPDMLRNWWRVHDWRAEISAGLPVSKAFSIPLDECPANIFVRDPRCVRHFLKDAFDKYTKPAPSHHIVFHYLNEWLGDGIFTVLHGLGAPDTGRSWHLQRKIAAGIFTRQNFNNLMREVFVAKSRRLCDLLAKPAVDGACVDLQHHLFCFTMDSIMQIFFGQFSDTLGGTSNEYAKAYDIAHKAFMEHSLKSMAALTLVKSLLPWPFGGTRGLAWQMCEAASPWYREFRAACKTLDAESYRMIDECRFDPDLPKRSDLMALFVKSESSEGFTHKFLRDVVLNFIIAGRDTTACILSWAFYVLATHPEVQARLCAEVDGRLPRGTAATLKAVAHAQMPYLQGVLFEALRLYPPVPVGMKEAMVDDVLPDGSPVPQGTLMFYLPYAMGRDAELYPEPEAVKPERWIPFVQPAPHDFPVFQAGPRICLGMDMAIFEAKLVMVMLLQEYTFELPPGEAEKITYGPKLTMNIVNGDSQETTGESLWVIPRRRHACTEGCSLASGSGGKVGC